jgi:hypothetical protein
MLPAWLIIFFIFEYIYCFFFFFLQYWGLNSGPSPWATPPALFCDFFFFQDSVSRTICPGLSVTLLISASWVGLQVWVTGAQLIPHFFNHSSVIGYLDCFHIVVIMNSAAINIGVSCETVAHTCNPTYSGCRDQEDVGLKPAWANSLWDPISIVSWFTFLQAYAQKWYHWIEWQFYF